MYFIDYQRLYTQIIYIVIVIYRNIYRKRFNRHPPNKDRYIFNILLISSVDVSTFTFYTTTPWLKVEVAEQNCCTIQSTETEESQVSSQVWTKPGSQADTARKC